MTQAFDLLLGYPFLQRALVVALVVALLCGVLGVFVVLRGLAMLGDGLAHVAFAGVAIGLAVGIYPLGAALAAAVLGAVAVERMRTRAAVRGDTAIGILFTAGLAIGVLVVSLRRGQRVDVLGYLFGNLLGVTAADLALVLGVAFALLVAVAVLRREFFYVTLSEEAARVAGLPVGVLNVVFTSLTAAAVVVAARVVGVLLVSALLVVPAAASLQLAGSFRQAVLLAVGVGLASVVAGVLASAQWGLATGATIALASTSLFTVAVALRRGLGR